MEVRVLSSALFGKLRASCSEFGEGIEDEKFMVSEVEPSPLIHTQYMDSIIEKQEDGTIVLNITIPQKTVRETTNEIILSIAKTANIAGFRKGKAPKKIVEGKVDKDKVEDEVLKKLLPKYYADAVKKHDLKPIINPRIHVETLGDDKDWKFTASTCEAPEIDLNGYKENIRKITSGAKIVIPGKEPFGVAQDKQKEASFDEIMTELQKSVKVKVSKIIVEQEVERLLAQTLSEIKRLGLTLDQYLASTHKTVEDLRKEYENKATNDIKLEFILQKIAEEEKITVADTEIDDTIKSVKDENERKGLEANKYLLASVIRQQKTLDFLKKL